MVTAHSLIKIISKSLPDFEKEIKTNTPFPSIYKIFQLFADFTKSLVQKGDPEAVRKSVLSACELWHKGDIRVKNAVENIYLHMLYPFTRRNKEMNGQLERILKENATPLYSKLNIDELF